MLSIITIIYHEVHSYQCYEMPLTSCNEIRRINHLLVSYSENYPGGEGGGGGGGEERRSAPKGMFLVPFWSENRCGSATRKPLN